MTLANHITRKQDDGITRKQDYGLEDKAELGRREFLVGAVAVSALAVTAGRFKEFYVGTKSGYASAPGRLGPRPAALSMLCAGNQSDGAGFAKVAPILKDAMGIDLLIDNLSYDALEQKTFAELATNNPTYQIFIVDTPWTPTLTHVLEPLSPYLLNSSLNSGIEVDPSDFIPKVFYDTSVYNIDQPSLHYPDPTAPVDPAKIPSKGFQILGLPIQANALTMAYRKDLFEDPKEQTAFRSRYGRALTVPTTWAEFLQVAQFFTRPSQKLYGTTLMAGVGDWDIDDFKTMVGSFGGDGHLINDSFGVDVSTPVAIEALSFYVDLIQKYKVTPPGTTSASWDTAGSLFASGVTAMTMNYAPQSLSSDVKGSIAYAMVPKKVAFAPHFGTWQLSVPKAMDANTKAWAYRVIAWLTSAKTQEAMLSTELHPTRASVFAMATKSKGLQSQFANFYPVLHQSLATGVGRARVKDYAQVTQPISVGVNNAARGNTSPARAMSSAASQVVRVLKSLGYSSAHVD